MVPCGQVWAAIQLGNVGRQTELEMSWCWGHDLCCPHLIGAHNLAFLIIVNQHTERQRQPYVRWQEFCAPHPLISLHVKGMCHEWIAVLPLLPTGLSRRGPRVSAQAWVSALALCLSAPPPLPPCRLCEGARQTSWLRDLFGGTGERAPG